MPANPPSTWFYSDGRTGKNPGDFIKQVEQGFTEKFTDTYKVDKVGQYLKSGSPAEKWYKDELSPSDSTTWKYFKAAYFTWWPKLKAVIKTHAKKIMTLQAHKLMEAKAVRKVEINGTEEWGYIRWADQVLVLANAVVDSDRMLIEGVRKDLPMSMAALVTGTYTMWASFTDTVRQIRPDDLLRAQVNNSWLAAVEEEL